MPVPPGRKPRRPLAPKSLCGPGPPHPAAGPARPLSWRAGRSSVTRLLFLSLCPLSLSCCVFGDAFAGSLRTFHAFGRAPDSLFMESVLGGFSGAGSTCFRQVAGSLATPSHRSPARLTAQLSRGVRPEDTPRPLSAAHRVPGSDAARLTGDPHAGRGQGGGPESAPAGDEVPKRLQERGVPALNAGQSLPGNPPEGPPAHPCSWGWPAGGSSEKCGRGSEVPLRRGRSGLGQMVRISPLRGLHGSGPGALWPGRGAVLGGTAGAGGGTGSAPAVSSAFSRRPLEGCEQRRMKPCPWCAVERRALPGSALSSPRSCSPAPRLSLSLSLSL